MTRQVPKQGQTVRFRDEIDPLGPAFHSRRPAARRFRLARLTAVKTLSCYRPRVKER